LITSGRRSSPSGSTRAWFNNGGRAPKDDPIQIEQTLCCKNDNPDATAQEELTDLKSRQELCLNVPNRQAATYQQRGLDVNLEFPDSREDHVVRFTRKTRNTADTDAEAKEKLLKIQTHQDNSHFFRIQPMAWMKKWGSPAMRDYPMTP
jgi:hypothetical protein